MKKLIMNLRIILAILLSVITLWGFFYACRALVKLFEEIFNIHLF